MLLLSFTGVTVYNTLAYHGLEYTTALNGSLMQSSAPLMIGLWSLVLFRDRLTLAQLVGICISSSASPPSSPMATRRRWCISSSIPATSGSWSPW